MQFFLLVLLLFLLIILGYNEFSSILKLAFTLVMGPFAFFDLGKTKYLQFVTTFFRWLGKRNEILYDHKYSDTHVVYSTFDAFPELFLLGEEPNQYQSVY